MRVTFRAVQGPSAGRQFSLEPDKVLEVGRTEWADQAFSNDARMSSRHFRVETDRQSCYIKDVGSTNGTFLNGQKVATRTLLRDGDQVVAGDTTFLVEVRDGREARPPNEDATLEWTPPRDDGRRKDPPPPPPPSDAKMVPYTAEKCESGLTLCRGQVADISPSDVAMRLSQRYPVYLMVDFRHLGTPPPPELADPQYLFDWFEPAVAALASPVLIAQEDYVLEWPKLIEKGWGNDAVVCLFSSQEKAAVWEHLRRACRVRSQGDNKVAAVLGICWPGVMAALLAHSAPRFVNELMSGIDAVLTEFPDLPESWQIFGGKGITNQLDELRFVRQAPEPVEAHEASWQTDLVQPTGKSRLRDKPQPSGGG